jgi:hypothetical protein
MKTLENEKGIALVTALLFTLISLGIVMALLYYVTQGTKLTAARKRYVTSLEASYGGVDMVTREFIPKLFSGYSSTRLTSEFAQVNLSQSVTSPCLKHKLQPDQFPDVCAPDSYSLNAKSSPDFIFQLKGVDKLGHPTLGFNVFSKIVETLPGNSDPSNIDYLDSGAGVTGGSFGVDPQHIPAKFHIEVQGEREGNPREKSQLSVLYAY